MTTTEFDFAAQAGAARTVNAERPAVEDVLGSLSGWDELAIRQFFGARWSEMLQDDASMLTRAMVFTVERRKDGVEDGAAYRAAMALTLSQVNDMFSDDDPEAAAKAAVQVPTEGDDDGGPVVRVNPES